MFDWCLCSPSRLWPLPPPLSTTPGTAGRLPNLLRCLCHRNDHPWRGRRLLRGVHAEHWCVFVQPHTHLPPDLPRRCAAAQIPYCMPGFRLSPVISTALVLSLSPPKCHRPDTAYVDASWHYVFTGCMGFIPPYHTNAYTHTRTHNAYARMHTNQITHNLWTGSFATSQVLVPKWV